VPARAGGTVTSSTAQDAAEERRRRRLGQRRQHILAAAAAVFAEVGYERATLEAVGERVGLSKASLYYYVASKEELLAHLLVEVIELMEREISALTAEGAGPVERLRAFLTGHIRVICTNPSGRLLATHEELVLGGANSELMTVTRRRHARHLRDIIEAGIAEGAFRDVDVRVTAYSVLAALNGVARWWQPSGPSTPDSIADQLNDLFLAGLRLRRA
jgi:TetR/AcrR family transcriptional regulator, cholesterol catabolism regulator